jgi:hypothetical protein
MLTAPVFGSFDGRGRGLFYGQDMLDGRAILVRFVNHPAVADRSPVRAGLFRRRWSDLGRELGGGRYAKMIQKEVKQMESGV